MANWTMEEVLRLALRQEMENYGEYKKASERMENPAVRKMFAFLMEEEKRHIRLIRDKMVEFQVAE